MFSVKNCLSILLKGIFLRTKNHGCAVLPGLNKQEIPSILVKILILKVTINQFYDKALGIFSSYKNIVNCVSIFFTLKLKYSASKLPVNLLFT